jgi:hypothetical protein
MPLREVMKMMIKEKRKKHEYGVSMRETINKKYLN